MWSLFCYEFEWLCVEPAVLWYSILRLCDKIRSPSASFFELNSSLIWSRFAAEVRWVLRPHFTKRREGIRRLKCVWKCSNTKGYWSRAWRLFKMHCTNMSISLSISLSICHCTFLYLLILLSFVRVCMCVCVILKALKRNSPQLLER